MRSVWTLDLIFLILIKWWRFQTYLSTPSWRRIQVWRLCQKFKLYFRSIYSWHSRQSLCLQHQATIYQHIFFKISKVTIWRKQQKHWRAKKDCWKMSGIGWTATPWFVILLTTYFTYNFTLYKYFLSMCFFSQEKSLGLRKPTFCWKLEG